MKLITNRRAEIERELAGLNDQIKGLQAEMAELAVVEKVFARLSGKAEPERARRPEAQSEKVLTVREMIKAALMDARQRKLSGLLPKDIRAFIHNTYGAEIGQQINTTASRMWHTLKEIEKDEETGMFSLPNEKPADDATVESPSAGFESNDQHDREAGQGGAS